MSMSYLDQFQKHLRNHDYPAFLTLWEEYCMGDEVDGEELKRVLKSVKSSELASPFGRHVENALDLWETIKDTDLGQEIFKFILDLQTTNLPSLAQKTRDYLRNRFAEDSYYNDKIRLIGLREGEEFQGAVSNYELLTHMKKGNFVFHTGGWGIGEIMDISFLREQLSVEFDYVSGQKDLSFQNAFKTLIPIPHDHFLALRFGNPDALEERARTNPVEIIHILLRDLGPSTAAEIKEALCELVIPNEEWARWWQTARSKVKKDTMIETPEDIRNAFKLRETEVTHEDRLQKALEKKPDASTLIQMVYSFLRDFPQTMKNEEFKNQLKDKVQEALSIEELTDAQELQLHFFMEDLTADKGYMPAKELIKRFSSTEDIIKAIDIMAFKKRALIEVHSIRDNWALIFLNLLLTVDQNPIRDYILTELLKAKKIDEVSKKLDEMLAYSNRHPQVLLWYFQKVMRSDSLPHSDQEGKNRLFESFLILLSSLEQSLGYRELIKKMYTFLITGRYNNVRKIFQKASKEIVQEFLLLATKCQTLTDHDIKIFHSLAEVVHPSLANLGEKYTIKDKDKETPIWTTEKGYQKVKKRIHQISTVETVENAKEIEAARAHGDLRENAEFKAALEKRDRLQSELKTLSEQFNQARILTKNDVSTAAVEVGVIIDCKDSEGSQISYTLLGPWETDPEQHVLSFQSKLAQSLMGHKVGDKISVQGKNMTISGLRNYFETE